MSSNPICADAQPPRTPDLMPDFPELPEGLIVFGGVTNMVTCRYPPEMEIARELMGTKAKLKAWRAIVKVLEPQGFPKVDPVFGGRSWPAVCAWLDQYDNLAKVQAAIINAPGDWR